MKYILFWVFSGLIATSNIGICEELVTKGLVKVDDKPIKGGNIIIYEYVGKAGMPDVKIHSVISTDREGRFSTTINHLGGDLDIQLIKDKCDWKSTSELISAEQIEKEVSVNMKAKPHNCKVR